MVVKIAEEILTAQLTQELVALRGQYQNMEDVYNKYKSYIDQCYDGVYLVDQSGRFIEVNPAGYEMLGYTEAELLNMNIVDVSDQTKLEPSLKHFDSLRTTGKANEILQLIKKDGSKIIVENHAVDLGDKFLGFVRDITERVNIERELQQYRCNLEQMVAERTRELLKSNLKLQQEIEERKKIEQELRIKSHLLDATSDTIIAHDLEGNFLYVNETAYKVLGYTREELLRKKLSDINSEDYSKLISLRINELMEKGEIVFESAHIHRDGTLVPMEVNARRMFLNNSLEPIIIGVSRDITERKNNEKEFAKLAGLNAIGEMAAGVAHEIRNPLTTVRGFLQLLKAKEQCTYYQNYADLMLGELDRANAIITEFFALAKNKKVSKERRNLNTIVQTMLPLLESDAILADKQISLVLGDIPELLLDEMEIRQLILNLVRNGLEAMNSGGQLTISTFSEHQAIVMAVQDQGPGIDPTVLVKLGTPFFTTKAQGTGLGLSVCYGIAHRHNATIKVCTGPDGTEFRVVFGL